MGANIDKLLPKIPGTVRVLITANRGDAHALTYTMSCIIVNVAYYTANQLVLYSANRCLFLSHV